MPKRISTDLVTIGGDHSITVLSPQSGVVGTFIEQVSNMFKARAMRMNGLLRRIDEAGQRTESMLYQLAFIPGMCYEVPSWNLGGPHIIFPL
jgi:hypothetical protein